MQLVFTVNIRGSLSCSAVFWQKFVDFSERFPIFVIQSETIGVLRFCHGSMLSSEYVLLLSNTLENCWLRQPSETAPFQSKKGSFSTSNVGLLFITSFRAVMSPRRQICVSLRSSLRLFKLQPRTSTRTQTQKCWINVPSSFQSMNNTTKLWSFWLLENR